MDAAQLRGMNVKDLRSEATKVRVQIKKHKIALLTKESTATHTLGNLKKYLARILTIIQETCAQKKES